jgi:hypothetical protein
VFALTKVTAGPWTLWNYISHMLDSSPSIEYLTEIHKRETKTFIKIPIPSHLRAADLAAPAVRTIGECCIPPIPELTTKPTVVFRDAED